MGAKIILETAAETAKSTLYDVDWSKPKENSSGSKRNGFRAARNCNFNGERETERRDKSEIDKLFAFEQLFIGNVCSS